jgi:hypothetical protein
MDNRHIRRLALGSIRGWHLSVLKSNTSLHFWSDILRGHWKTDGNKKLKSNHEVSRCQTLQKLFSSLVLQWLIPVRTELNYSHLKVIIGQQFFSSPKARGNSTFCESNIFGPGIIQQIFQETCFCFCAVSSSPRGVGFRLVSSTIPFLPCLQSILVFCEKTDQIQSILVENSSRILLTRSTDPTRSDLEQ